MSNIKGIKNLVAVAFGAAVLSMSLIGCTKTVDGVAVSEKSGYADSSVTLSPEEAIETYVHVVSSSSLIGSALTAQAQFYCSAEKGGWDAEQVLQGYSLQNPGVLEALESKMNDNDLLRNESGDKVWQWMQDTTGSTACETYQNRLDNPLGF